MYVDNWKIVPPFSVIFYNSNEEVVQEIPSSIEAWRLWVVMVLTGLELWKWQREECRSWTNSKSHVSSLVLFLPVANNFLLFRVVYKLFKQQNSKYHLKVESGRWRKSCLLLFPDDMTYYGIFVFPLVLIYVLLVSVNGFQFNNKKQGNIINQYSSN